MHGTSRIGCAAEREMVSEMDTTRQTRGQEHQVGDLRGNEPREGEHRTLRATLRIIKKEGESIGEPLEW